MRPVRVSLNAAGYSQWVLLDYIESWFGVTIAGIPSEDASLTYSAQFVLDYDTIQTGRQTQAAVSISRSGTTATVTDYGPNGLGHGLTTGDSVIVKGTGSTVLDSPAATIGQGELGWQVASTPSAHSWTYTVTNSGATSDQGTTSLVRLRVFPHTVLNAVTARTTGSINYPVRGVRLYISSYSAGYCDLLVLQGMQT